VQQLQHRIQAARRCAKLLLLLLLAPLLQDSASAEACWKFKHSNHCG
jgi:hypothetical protein